MDTFIEQIVVKKKTPTEHLLTAALILAAVAVMAVALLFLPAFIFPFVAIGAGYGLWWLITGLNMEFEYCVTNGDIDVDQIIARRQRKRLVSVAGRKIESLLPYAAAQVPTGYQRVVMAAPAATAAGLWCFAYHSKKNGHTLVIFQPEERVLSALYAGLPKLVQLEAARAAREQGIVLSSGRYGHGGEE